MKWRCLLNDISWIYSTRKFALTGFSLNNYAGINTITLGTGRQIIAAAPTFFSCSISNWRSSHNDDIFVSGARRQPLLLLLTMMTVSDPRGGFQKFANSAIVLSWLFFCMLFVSAAGRRAVALAWNQFTNLLRVELWRHFITPVANYCDVEPAIRRGGH